jgi:histone H1/5
MSYKAEIVKAITALKDRNGSSSIAIKKHMQANLPADKKWLNTMFLNALKKAVADGVLTKVKSSYKLSADFKKAASKPKKVAPKKKSAPKKKAATKEKTAPKKKSAPKKKAVSVRLRCPICNVFIYISQHVKFDTRRLITFEQKQGP